MNRATAIAALTLGVLIPSVGFAQSTCIPTFATFNTTRQAPACGSVCACDTGTTVLNGRGTMTSGVESNSPNTVQDSCADGNLGTYHVDESIDRMSVRTVDQGLITPGKQLTVDVTVWCYDATDRVDLYYATNAAAPAWATLTTNLACTARGARTFSHSFTAGAVTGQHAVRAQLRYGGTVGTCTAGSYNDRDDLVFTVVAP